MSPPIVHASLNSKDFSRRFADSRVLVVTLSMFTDINDVRFTCMLESCKLIEKYQIPVICVDDSPAHVFAELKPKLESESNGWIRVSKFQGKGKKGASLREAIAIAVECKASTSGVARWAIAFTELEKTDFFPHLHKCATPILQGDADLVTPFRNLELFESTYAIEQFYSERIGNMHMNMKWKMDVGDPKFPNLDWYFGPILWNGSTVSQVYMDGVDLHVWDAQIVPAIRAYKRGIAKRWASIEIPYRHPQVMKMQEEDNITFCEKRMMQLQLVSGELAKSLGNDAVNKRRVLLCGASGNVGGKLMEYLVKHQEDYHVVFMDLKLPETRVEGVEYVQCDFLQPYNKAWGKHFANAHAVFLLAARNPFPDANAEEVFDSMRITANLLECCAEYKVKRVVYASSNHVMGGELYKEGKLQPNQVPNFGTVVELDAYDLKIDSTPYASAKVAGEAQIAAMVSANRLSRAIIWRIGYVLPGNNQREAITVTGMPHSELPSGQKVKRQKKEDADKEARVLKWYQGMHFSTPDLHALTECTLKDELDLCENRLIYVNGMSDNPDTRWVLGSQELGFWPQSAKASSTT